MEITIYADVLFAFNYWMDLLLLFLTLQLSREKLRVGRLSLATGVLALYGTIAFLPQLHLFASLLGRLLAGSLAVFLLGGAGGFRGFLKRSGIFYLVSVGMGGVLFALAMGTDLGRALKAVSVNGGVYLSVDIKILLAGIVLSYLLLWGFQSVCVRNFTRHRVLTEVLLLVGGQEITVTTLLDTGCELTAPLTGEGALLLPKELLKNAEPKESFLLPIQTAGGAGTLEAFYPDFAKSLDRRYELAEIPMVAVVAEPFAEDGLYSAICNPKIFREAKGYGGERNEKGEGVEGEDQKIFKAMALAMLSGRKKR